MYGGGDDINPAELRSIPLAVLREAVIDATERTSIRDVAVRIGVGRTTLHNFIHNETRNPHPRVKRLVALWYVGERGKPQVDYETCFRLVQALPTDKQDAAATELAAFVAELHRTYRGGAG